MMALALIKTIVNNNKYVVACTINTEKDFNSLSYLVDMQISQSTCIKLGIALESVLSDIIKTNLKLINIKSKNTKGKKERDHLFKNEETKTIYYAEIKSNLNLDTEKCKSTSDKCVQIRQELQLEYPDYTINMYLVGGRYYEKKIIPIGIMDKYMSISENVVGINEYLIATNTGLQFTREEYTEFINYTVSKMVEV